jgi:hypothetical protein
VVYAPCDEVYADSREHYVYNGVPHCLHQRERLDAIAAGEDL